MNIRTTRWSPDTCGCVIEYEWDRDLDPSVRTHTLKNIVQACPEHQALLDSDIWNCVMGENVRKNQVLALITERFGRDKDPDYPEVTWCYEGKGKARVLRVSLPTLAAAQRADLRVLANNEFGVGKVVVE